jgi:hypothetical protein
VDCIIENLQQKIFIRSSFEFAVRLLKNITISTRTCQSLDSGKNSQIVNRLFSSHTTDYFGIILLSLYHNYFIILNIIIVTIFLILNSTGSFETSMKESKYKYKVASEWLQEIARNNF